MMPMGAGVALRRIPGSGIPVVRVHYSADPTMTPERVAALRARYTSDARWRREMEIEYEALAGTRLYPEYQPEMHDCQPFDVSDPWRWTIWMACDPHMRTPHAFLWEAFGAGGERMVCGELWPGKQFTVREYAETLHWLESDSAEKPPAFEWANGKTLRVARRLMDTHGSAANSDEGVDFFDTYRGYGLHFCPAQKGPSALDAAHDHIGEALLPTSAAGAAQARPPLRIFQGCVETRRELENVRFPDGEVERPGQERPMTYRKHLLDCLHYIETAHPGFILPRRAGVGWAPIYPATAY